MTKKEINPNLKVFTPGHTRSRGPRKKFTQTKTIIRELLECDGYHTLVKNKGLIKELEEKFSGKKMSGRELIVVGQICKALKGDTSAFNALLDRMEGRPVQLNENVNTDVSYVDFLKRITEPEWSEEDDLEDE